MATFYGNTGIPIFINLALVTLADSIASNALEATPSPSTAPKRGFWNIGTTDIILSGVTDLTGQMFLAYMAVSKGPIIATLVNNLSVCLAATFTLIILQFPNYCSSVVFIVAPLFKIVGGGSHATAFLTLVNLHWQGSGSTRAILYYVTGGVVVISHLIGSFTTPLLASKSGDLPYALSVLCCAVSYCVLVRYIPHSGSSQSNNTGSDITESDSLLGPRETLSPSDDSRVSRALTFNTYHFGYPNQTYSTQNGEYRKIAMAFCLGGVPKAMRPLFTTYIQHRANINPSQAHKLWLLQSSLTVIINMLGFPCALCLLQSGASIRPAQSTLYAAKIGIVFMGIGALMIGLTDSASLLVPALIIDTLGVATELSLLAYLANLTKRHVAGQMFMLIASLESLGTLVGIAVLYPVYQWSVSQTSLAGGSPYYICATVYVALTWLIWGLGVETEDMADSGSLVHRIYL